MNIFQKKPLLSHILHIEIQILKIVYIVKILKNSFLVSAFSENV